MMVDIGEEKGAIQAGEKEMIENIFEFDNMTAGDVMIHRTDMVMLWVDDTAEEIAQTIESSGLSRFPVYEEDADDIIGILNTRDWLLNARKASPRPVRELLRPAYFVPESCAPISSSATCRAGRSTCPLWWTSTAAPPAS